MERVVSWRFCSIKRRYFVNMSDTTLLVFGSRKAIMQMDEDFKREVYEFGRTIRLPSNEESRLVAKLEEIFEVEEFDELMEVFHVQSWFFAENLNVASILFSDGEYRLMSRDEIENCNDYDLLVELDNVPMSNKRRTTASLNLEQMIRLRIMNLEEEAAMVEAEEESDSEMDDDDDDEEGD